MLSNYVLIWGLATALLVVVCVGLGMYAERAMKREFLGSQTRILHLCRENPDFDKKVCERVLMSRGELRRARNANSLQPIQRPSFALSGRGDDVTLGER